VTGPQLQQMILSQMEQYGEQVTLSRGGTNTTYWVFSDHPSNYFLQTNFFDSNELAGLAQPLTSLYLDGTCSGTNNPPQLLDTFVRDGFTWTVRKVGTWRLFNVVAIYLVMASSN
jgi:hypothetical protein